MSEDTLGLAANIKAVPASPQRPLLSKTHALGCGYSDRWVSGRRRFVSALKQTIWQAQTAVGLGSPGARVYSAPSIVQRCINNIMASLQPTLT
jgi:hypothetical protein